LASPETQQALYDLSCMPSRWKAVASLMFFSVYFFVVPVATQPGRSGEEAEKPVFVFSMMTKYSISDPPVLMTALTFIGEIVAHMGF
jgi:hypothetical protein